MDMIGFSSNRTSRRVQDVRLQFESCEPCPPCPLRVLDNFVELELAGAAMAHKVPRGRCGS